MATSKSDKQATQWIGGALIFSGRPDPVWRVPDEAARDLQSLWAGLQPSVGRLPVAPALGYRGAFLRDAGGREWLGYGGIVTLKTKNAVLSRLDPARQFEKMLLATAPPAQLPPEVIRAQERQ
jgi:hypothetical protein